MCACVRLSHQMCLIRLAVVCFLFHSRTTNVSETPPLGNHGFDNLAANMHVRARVILAETEFSGWGWGRRMMTADMVCICMHVSICVGGCMLYKQTLYEMHSLSFIDFFKQ